MMKWITDTSLLYRRKIREKLRNPPFIIALFAIPVIYLAFFSPLLTSLVGTRGFPEGGVLSLFVPGMLVISAFFNGLFAGWGAVDELRSGVIERFRSTSVSRFALLSGSVLADLVSTLFQAVLFILVALPFGFRTDIGGMCLLFLLLSLLVLTMSSLAHTLGIIVKSEDKLAPIVQANLPILLLSGALLPMSLAPQWLQVIAHFNPLYYIVEASRALCSGQILTPSVGLAFLVMLPLTGITMLWGTRVFSKAIY